MPICRPVAVRPMNGYAASETAMELHDAVKTLYKA
jgi:hypothetical protein